MFGFWLSVWMDWFQMIMFGTKEQQAYMNEMELREELGVDIVDVDYFEKDAILVYDGDRYYFQFDGDEPTVEDAISYIGYGRIGE